LFGTIENLSEEQARAQMETNFFGALWVTQAALPYLREQKTGDPTATQKAILTLVDTPNPPLRLFLPSGNPRHDSWGEISSTL